MQAITVSLNYTLARLVSIAGSLQFLGSLRLAFLLGLGISGPLRLVLNLNSLAYHKQ